jgi:hypothetical protein
MGALYTRYSKCSIFNSHLWRNIHRGSLMFSNFSRSNLKKEPEPHLIPGLHENAVDPQLFLVFLEAKIGAV